MSQVAPSPKRTDAMRNRARILDVARAAFLEAKEPSMAEVARRAGVGMATLYRHFPGRLELLTELYRAEIEGLCHAATAAPGDTPIERLVSWLGAFHAAGVRRMPLISVLLAEPAHGDEVVVGSRLDVIRAGAPLLKAAQDAGEVRADVAIREVLDAIAALGQVGDEETGATLVQVFVDGLRARPRRPPRRAGGGRHL